MIRDPSDGSVRDPESRELMEMAEEEARKPSGPAMDHEPTRKFMMGEITSGLPISKENLKEIERLGKSREWIREYFKKKTTE